MGGGYIEENKLIIKKDGNSITLVKFLDNDIKINNNKKKIKIKKDELEKLNYCINLYNNLIPNYEEPNIPEEGLIVVENNEDNIKFTNGATAIFDEENDEYILNLPNGEKFNGILNDDESGKYWLEKGAYTWPSGQEYIGEFNENNKFQSMDGDLKMKDSWSYKGWFKNGKIDDKGKFEWNNNNYLDSYFSDGKINGMTTISWSNNIINGVFKNINKDGVSKILVEIFEAKFDNHIYKIKKIDQEKIPNDGKITIIEKDDNEYFSGIIFIDKNKIKIEEYNIIEDKEKNRLLNCLNSIENIVIPKFKPFSFNKNEFIPKNEIKFQNGIIYNNKTKKLTLKNGEYFEGVLNYDEKNNKYNLDIGEYNWPSGQKYLGKFDDKNNFEGDKAIISNKNFSFKGHFNNGNPNGYGEILWENGDYVKGNFKEEKINGHAEIKKNGISFEANYKNSIMNGAFSNIKISKNNHNFKISKISINKGIINDDFFDIEDEEGKTNQIELSKEDKVIFHYNEEEILFLFKYLSKIRRLNITFFSPTSIADEGLNFNEDNNKKNKKNKNIKNDEDYKEKNNNNNNNNNNNSENNNYNNNNNNN